jgi:uncharacterized protein YjbI with pentapeptide repeats
MDQQQQSRWRPTRRQVLWTLGIVAILTVAVLIGYRYGITLWDWIKLLIVPAAIAIGAAWLNWAQRQREREAEAAQERERQAQEARRDREREAEAAQRQREREATEEARIQCELEVEDQRAQDAALQAFLDQMGQLLLDKDRPLRQSEEGDEVSILARARTLTVLTRLDGERKRSVLQFLYESGLLGKYSLALDLGSADLSQAKLKFSILEGAVLHDANLRGANLRGAVLSYADLSGAYLEGADLSEVFLSGANLRLAYLRDADLRDADLRDADLSGAAGVTNEELEQQASSLEGATMPNGLKYEDWLKSKGRGEDGENSAPS